MRQAIADYLLILALVTLAAGVWLVFGGGWALVVGGVGMAALAIRLGENRSGG